MSLRTLKFGDRTISYDTGLNFSDLSDDIDFSERRKIRTAHQEPAGIQNEDERDQADDGIGTSDDETNSNSSTLSNQREFNDRERSKSADSSQSRRVIKLDVAAISQLLAFDEEDEDELDDDTDVEDNACQNNKAWKKNLARDLAKLKTSEKSDKSQLQRGHSITLCESRKNRKASSEESNPGPPEESERSSVETSNNFASLSVAAFQEEQHFFEAPAKKSLQTLDLRLEEVAHIRSVLTKAELEAMPLANSVRDNVAAGKMCFHCMRTKFGLFSRGQKCDMCKQLFCSNCYSKMRIPLEHFSATPVFALSPAEMAENDSGKITDDAGSIPATNKPEKKRSLPDGLVLNSSVGSAPNSPKLGAKNLNSGRPTSLVSVPTISSAVARAQSGLASLQQQPAKKYATLPTKTRRMSWLSSREIQREQLEGSLLAVCVDCKTMVLQVIRVSRTTRRTLNQQLRTDFVSITPMCAR